MLRLALFGEFSAAGADGTEIAIKSKKAKALLAYLALSPKKSRSREEIIALLWSDRGEAQARASLRQVLVGLRRDLGEAASQALIVTNEAIALDLGNLTIEVANQGEELLAGFHLHDPAFEDWLRDERLRHEDMMPGSRPPERPLPDKPSIAVLPFTNLSADPEQDYFTEGITEDIITAIARFRNLFVIARESSFKYKGNPVTVQDVGRDLGVQFVLEGSVRRAGERIRVTAQLVDAATGHHVWAEFYDRELNDIFAVQDDITQMIVSMLAGRIEGSMLERAKRKRPESFGAYDYVLRADESLWLYSEGDWAGMKESIENSRQMFLKAIELDPSYGRAYEGLAHTHYMDWAFLLSETLYDDFEKALEYAQKAVDLDEAESRAHYTLAATHAIRKEYERTRFHCKKAMVLNPNDADTLVRISYLLSLLGEHEEAIEVGERALRLNPYHPPWYLTLLCVPYFASHRYQEAITAIKGARTSYPDDDAWLAACYAYLGELDEARTLMKNFLRSSGPEAWWMNVPDTTPHVERDPTGLLRYAVFMFPFKNRSDLDHLLNGLRKAGLPE